MKHGSWALFHKELILDLEGLEYLSRFRVFMTPWCSVYFHRIHKPDHDRALHGHPFWFASLVLTGGYTEERSDTPTDGSIFWDDQRRTVIRMPWTIKSMRRNEAHMITGVLPNTRTLIFTGKRDVGEDSWGFWRAGDRRFVPWRRYLTEQGHPQAGER